MDRVQRSLLTILLVLGAAVGGARGNTLVSGFVFCDHCKDGKITLFDNLIAGTKVTLSCTDKDGKTTMSEELTTNILGNYAIVLEGTPDLSGCQVQVSPGQNWGCMASPGAAQNLKLTSELLGFATYNVEPLLSSPANLPIFCPRRVPNPIPNPRPRPTLPPPAVTPSPAPPAAHSPTPSSTPPFLGHSACPNTIWMDPNYRCYWKFLKPDTKVATAFGSLAAMRYGTDMTLLQALQYQGSDPYMTLLREAITATLNAYTSIQFPYASGVVARYVNFALMGTQNVHDTAQMFRAANSGTEHLKCEFAKCK